jgi:hypothetical protein
LAEAEVGVVQLERHTATRAKPAQVAGRSFIVG